MGLASEIIQKVTNAGNSLLQSVDSGIGEATEYVRKNPVTSAASVAGGVLAGGTVVQIVRNRSKKRAASKTKNKTSSKTKKTKSSNRKRKSNKSKKNKSGSKSSRGKIKHTKKGQPYIILPSGKARFISKKSEKARKKRKGGYY